MDKIRTLVAWLVFAAASTLLVLHVLNVPGINIDGITLSLLGLLLVIPLVDFVRKIKIGDFEAEIDPREVTVAVEKASAELDKTDRVKLLPEPPSPGTGGLLELVRENPALGLAQLRMDVERSLRTLDRVSDGRLHDKPIGLARLAASLGKRSVLPVEIEAAIKDIIPIANRAVHGEAVRQSDALQIAEVGVDILNGLRWVLSEHGLGTVAHEPITSAERDDFAEARYRVTTIVPLVDGPYRVVREVDQRGLDDLLEGYDEYAEFLVAVERINAQDGDVP